MPAKELKATEDVFGGKEGMRRSAEEMLARALPLARKYPAEKYLRGTVTSAAKPTAPGHGAAFVPARPRLEPIAGAVRWR
jgi:hypothetical protein